MRKFLDYLKHLPAGVISAFVYTAAALITRGLSVITVPIFTRLMTSEQMGVVQLYNSWYGLIGAFATLSLTSGGYAIALKEYEKKRDQYESSVLTLTTLLAVLLVVVYFICPLLWQQFLGLPNELIVLMLIGFLFTPARDFWLARQRYEYKYKLSGLVSILTAVLATVASVLVVVDMNNRNLPNIAEGRLFSSCVVTYGVAAVIWFYILIKGKTFFDKQYWTMSLALSLPLVGFNIAGQILNTSDKVMISHMIDNSAVGIYGILYTVSSLSLLVWQAINTSFVPYLFQNIEKKEQKIGKVASSLMCAYAFVAIFVTYFAPEIVRVLATDEYYQAIFIMPPIAAGVFLTAFSNLYSNLAVYYKKTKYVMYPAIIAAIVNLILNYIFISLFGYFAAAYTTLASFAVQSLLQAVWSKRICTQNGVEIGTIYSNKEMFLIAAVTIVGCMIGIPLYMNAVIRYIVITIISVVFVVFGKKLLKNGMLIKQKEQI